MAVIRKKSVEMEKTEYNHFRNTVYTFFYYSNKPVNFQELALQFKEQSKKNIETVLDDLVAKEKIFVKFVGAKGKTKIYCLAQNHNYEIDEAEYTDEIDEKEKLESKNEKDDKILRYYEWKYKQITNELIKAKEISNQLDKEIVKYNNEMTVEELRDEISKMKNEIEKHMDGNSYEYVDQIEFEKVKNEMEKIEKEISRSKKIFNEMVATISDGLEMDKNELLENSGVEL